MKSSKLFNLNIQDFIKGLILTVLTSVAVIIKTTIESGSLTFDWPTIGKYAMIAAISYLMKNLLTNSKDEFGVKENK